jgi:uncharacterized lipoprotein YajG
LKGYLPFLLLFRQPVFEMRGLQLSACVALLAACAANASLLNSEPDYALILSRQAPGTPQFECHSNCGKTNKFFCS